MTSTELKISVRLTKVCSDGEAEKEFVVFAVDFREKKNSERERKRKEKNRTEKWEKKGFSNI